MADQGETVVQSDESTSPSEDLHLVEGGKKDPYTRRQELLLNSRLAEVARGGSDDVLHTTLHESVASLAAESKSEESEEEHIHENFYSSRTIRKLVLDYPIFASTLWEKALRGIVKCDLKVTGSQ